MTRKAGTHDPGGRVKPKWPKDSKISASFSACNQYRYSLKEIWNPRGELVLWILMNPSVACVEHSDPTLRRTGAFSRHWGYGGQLVGNIFAYRSTNKMNLLTTADPVGPENDTVISSMAAEAGMVILAYGQPPGALSSRGREVARLIKEHPNVCHLKLSSSGIPVHPLYLPATLKPTKHQFF